MLVVMPSSRLVAEELRRGISVEIQYIARMGIEGRLVIARLTIPDLSQVFLKYRNAHEFTLDFSV